MFFEYPPCDNNIIQYIIPSIEPKNIVSKIFIGPNHIPKTIINCKSPNPSGCFFVVIHVSIKTIDKYGLISYLNKNNLTLRDIL